MRAARTITVSGLALLGVATDALARPQGKASLDGTPATAGNGFYSVHVERSPGSGVGLYTVTTGPRHPAGPGINVLFGNGQPATSYSSIRSYTSQIDYVQVTGGAASTYTVLSLDAFARQFSQVGNTGFSTVYKVTGRDQLTVMQVVMAQGSTPGDASVEVTTTITNDGSRTVELGLRYLWDPQIGADDGPTLQELTPQGPVRLLETNFSRPSFEQFQMLDNDVNTGVPTLAVRGTVHGPSWVQPKPTPPDEVQLVCWQDAFLSAFDYTVNPSRSVASSGSSCRAIAGGDTAITYFWGGPSSAQRISLAPGASRTFSASLYADAPPTCTGAMISYGTGCPGTGGVIPALSHAGCAEIGASVTLTASKVVGGGQGALVLGLGRAAISVAGCQLLVQPPLQAIPLSFGGTPGAPGAGSVSLTLSIPGLPQHVGVGFHVQAFIADAAAPSGLSGTEAREIFIGF